MAGASADRHARRTFDRRTWRGGLGHPEEYPVRRADDLRRLLRALERSLTTPTSQGDEARRPIGREERPRLPVALVSRRLGAFVGRAFEQTSLARQWAAVRDGGAGVVFVYGESGLGKSELVYELARSTLDEGVVLASRPSASGTRAHAELADLVGQILELGLTAAPTEGLDDGEIRALRLVVPERFGPEERAHALNPVGDRRALNDALARMVRQVASNAPVLIVVEDMHAATPDSVLVLGNLIERRIERTLVVVTSRLNDPGSRYARQLEDIAARAGSHRILRLEAWTEAEIDTLVQDAIEDLDHGWNHAGLGAALHAATRGHPWAAITLLDDWVSTGEVPRLESRPDTPVPEAFAAPMARRVDALMPEAKEVLWIAAVIGEEVDVNVLARSLGRELDEGLLGVLHALQQAGLLVGVAERPERLRFEHQLARHAVALQIEPLRKAFMHEKVADALAADVTQDVVASYAHHCYEAARVDLARRPASVRASIDAGRDSLRRLAYEDGVEHFERAVEHCPSDEPELSTRANAGLGDALWRLGRLAEARAVLDEAARTAQQLGTAELFAELATTLSFVAFQSNAADRRLLALYENALGMLPPAESYWRLRLMAAISRELTIDLRATRMPELARQVEALDAEQGDPSSHAFGLLIRHDALFGEDNPQRARFANRLVAAAEEAGEPFLIFTGHGQRLYAALETLDLRTANEAIDSCEKVGQRFRFRYATWHAALYRASLALFQRPLNEAEALMTGARDIGDLLGYDEVELMHQVQIAYLRRERGQGEQAGDIVERGAERYELPVWQAALASGLCETRAGSWAKTARKILAPLEAAGVDALPRDGTYPLLLSFLASAYAYLRDRRGAERLLPVLQDCRHRHPVVAGNATFWGSMSYHIGVLQATAGDHAAALASFAIAQRHHRRIRSPLWTALTHVVHAQVLQARGSMAGADEAERLLAAARALATEYGYGRVRAQIARTGPTLIGP